MRIKQKLQKAGCEQLLFEQQEICALSAIRFHPVYGLTLEICDVDPIRITLTNAAAISFVHPRHGRMCPSDTGSLKVIGTRKFGETM